MVAMRGTKKAVVRVFLTAGRRESETDDKKGAVLALLKVDSMAFA